MSLTVVDFRVSCDASQASRQFAKELRAKRIQEIVLTVFTLGVYALGALLLRIIIKKLVPVVFMPSIRRRSTAKCPSEFRSLTIETLDKVKLNAAEWMHENSKKWLLFFCPNAIQYEQASAHLQQVAKDLKVNLLLFNYRQVGNSQGQLRSGYQLKLDGAAMLEYLLQQKLAKEADITLYGHSMGGVGATLVPYYPKIKVIADRTFNSTSAVVPKGFGPLLALTGFNIDIFQTWKKMPDAQKLILYHHADRVIPYHKSSLYYADKEHRKDQMPQYRVFKTAHKQVIPKDCKPRSLTGLLENKKPPRVKLKCLHGKAHDYKLKDSEYQEFIQKANGLIWHSPS